MQEVLSVIGKVPQTADKYGWRQCVGKVFLLHIVMLDKGIFKQGQEQILQWGYMQENKSKFKGKNWKAERSQAIQGAPQGKLPSSITTSLLSCSGGLSASVLPSSPFLLSAFFTIFTAGEALAARNWFWKCIRSASDSPGFGLDNILPSCSCRPALCGVHMEDVENRLEDWCSWGKDKGSKRKLHISVLLCCFYTNCSSSGSTSGSPQDTTSCTRVPDKPLTLFFTAKHRATRQANTCSSIQPEQNGIHPAQNWPTSLSLPECQPHGLGFAKPQKYLCQGSRVDLFQYQQTRTSEGEGHAHLLPPPYCLLKIPPPASLSGCKSLSM